MKKIGSLINPFVKGLGIEEALRLEEIRRGWAGIAGMPLSLHIWPYSLKNKELLINADSPAWLQQVSFFKLVLMQKLVCFGVGDIRFRLGRVCAQQCLDDNKAEAHDAGDAVLDRETQQYIETAVSGIENNGVKESIRKAMEKAFLRSSGRRPPQRS